MTNIILSGCNGRMGQAITRLVEDSTGFTISAGIDVSKKESQPYPVFESGVACDVAADVIIDFSFPDALPDLLALARKKGMGLVVATTGHNQEQLDAIMAASGEIPVFKSGNMSLGINLLLDLVERAAKALEDNYDIELIEKHHNQKVDAPSGTALMIADAINQALKQKKNYMYERESRREKRAKSELGIHSLRGGTLVGEHSVLFAGYNEAIEITHTAYSREIFATGALKAAEFLAGQKPGLYHMKDLLG